MDYIYIDGVQIIKYRELKDEQEVQNIVDNTANTWQEGRPKDEKIDDTIQGKNAEDVFIEYVAEYKDFKYISYDSFRNDNEEKHAPFDGLLYKKRHISFNDIEQCKKMILEDVKNDSYGQIKSTTRNFLRQKQIYTVEIKSTKTDNKQQFLSQEDKINPNKLIPLIRNDDYFLYPKFCRTSKTINNLTDYFQYVKQRKYFEWEDENDFLFKMFKYEYENASDIQIRIYYDKIQHTWYILGYILKFNILKTPVIKKFYSKKSQDALYFAKSLKYGRPLNCLFSDPELWDSNTFTYGFVHSQQLSEYIKSTKK